MDLFLEDSISTFLEIEQYLTYLNGTDYNLMSFTAIVRRVVVKTEWLYHLIIYNGIKNSFFPLTPITSFLTLVALLHIA